MEIKSESNWRYKKSNTALLKFNLATCIRAWSFPREIKNSIIILQTFQEFLHHHHHQSSFTSSVGWIKWIFFTLKNTVFHNNHHCIKSSPNLEFPVVSKRLFREVLLLGKRDFSDLFLQYFQKRKKKKLTEIWVTQLLII